MNKNTFSPFDVGCYDYYGRSGCRNPFRSCSQSAQGFYRNCMINRMNALRRGIDCDTIAEQYRLQELANNNNHIRENCAEMYGGTDCCNDNDNLPDDNDDIELARLLEQSENAEINGNCRPARCFGYPNGYNRGCHTEIGAAIPFSSRSEVVLDVPMCGGCGSTYYVGFGNCVPGLDKYGKPVDINRANIDKNLAFTVPHSGVISDVSATFDIPARSDINGCGCAKVHAVLYKAAPFSSIFTPLTRSDVALGSVAFNRTSKHVLTKSHSNLNIPVKQGEELMMVFYAESDQPSTNGKVKGYASAGVSFAFL